MAEKPVSRFDPSCSYSCSCSLWLFDHCFFSLLTHLTRYLDDERDQMVPELEDQSEKDESLDYRADRKKTVERYRHEVSHPLLRDWEQARGVQDQRELCLHVYPDLPPLHVSLEN